MADHEWSRQQNASSKPIRGGYEFGMKSDVRREDAEM
jgi:hypothetical protein